MPPTSPARWLLTAVAAGALSLAAGPAHSDPATAVGWWSTSSSGGVQSVLAGVPKDGLLVQGGSSAGSIAAYAALRYAVPSSAQVVRIDLPIASRTSASTGAVACRLTVATFTPAHGGSSDTAPPYDCAGAVPGTTADGKTFSFAVAPLVHDGALAVAIVPTAANARVVFSAPGSAAVVTAPLSSPAATPRTSAARPSTARRPVHRVIAPPASTSASASATPAMPELAVLPPPELPAEATARALDVPAPIVVGPPSSTPDPSPTPDVSLSPSATADPSPEPTVAIGDARTAPASVPVRAILESVFALLLAGSCLLPTYVARRQARRSDDPVVSTETTGQALT